MSFKSICILRFLRFLFQRKQMILQEASVAAKITWFLSGFQILKMILITDETSYMAISA